VTEYLVLVMLYVLTEKLCVIAAKNAAIEAIRAVMGDRVSDGLTYTPNIEVVNVMYSGTPQGFLGR
jgi:hypothetical protein